MYPYYKNTLAGVILLQVLMLSSCQQDAVTVPQQEANTFAVSNPAPAIKQRMKTSIDTISQSKPRSRKYGGYTYNYDVKGKDLSGNNVTGNVNMYGRYGVGTLLDKNKNKVDVRLQWVGELELEAQDRDGNFWKLEVK